MTNAESQGEVRPRVFLVGLGLVLIASGWIRFEGLTADELWLDEVCTYYCVKHGDAWPADGPDRDREVTHRAYLLALRTWTKVVGNDAWGLRSFSALAGMATVGMLGVLTARLVGRTTGLVTALLAAVNPLHVHYSQEARAYAMWCLVVTLGLFCLIRAAQRMTWRWWAAYAASALLAMKTHDCTAFLLPATLGAIVIVGRRRRFLGQWLAVHLVLGFLLIVSMWGFLQTQVGGGSKAWIAREWAGYPPWAAVLKSVWAMLPSGGYPNYLGPLSNATGWGGALLSAALLLWVLFERNRRDSQEWRIGKTALVVTLGFLAVAWVFSMTVYPAYVVGRYDLAAWPGMMIGLGTLTIAAGRGLNDRTRWMVTVCVTLAFAVCGVSTIQAARERPAVNDLAERAKRMAAVVGRDDLLVSVSIYKWFLLYEWDRIGFAPNVISFPPEHDRQLGWEDAVSELKDPAGLDQGVESVVGKITDTLATGRRVWLIAQGKPEGPRWDVDRRLFEALRTHGFSIAPVDDWLGLAKVERIKE